MLPVSITAYSDKTFTYVSSCRMCMFDTCMPDSSAISAELLLHQAMLTQPQCPDMAGHQDAAGVILCEASAWQEVRQPEARARIGRHAVAAACVRDSQHQAAGPPRPAGQVAVQQHHRHMPEYGREHCQGTRHAASSRGSGRHVTRNGKRGAEM